MKNSENNLSGLYAPLTLEHWGNRVGYEGRRGVWVEGGLGWYRRSFVILHLTVAERGMEIEQCKKCSASEEPLKDFQLRS